MATRVTDALVSPTVPRATFTRRLYEGVGAPANGQGLLLAFVISAREAQGTTTREGS